MQYNQDKPIYLQIADYMQDQILSGSWKDEQRIPSIRDMAIEMEVNPNTVTRTYNYLQEQGIIDMQRGIGYFTSPQAEEKVREIKRAECLDTLLPEVVRTMIRVGITIEEFNALYYHYTSQESQV
ncbi:MAG: GntR family transcriptional regulator [Spirochaetota bacterium]